MTAVPTIVVVCMPERGHLQRLLPLIAGLVARGATVPVMTAGRFAPEVARAGGHLLDVFARYPVDAVDATSIPVPSRYVTFAAAHAGALSEEVAALAPALIVYDTFAVVAPLIARRLGVPWVNVCAGHAAVPSRTVAALRADPRVVTSPACWDAVHRLRDVHGLPNANPFSYVEAVSPHLNVYCEPPQFLAAADRPAFEPVVFFGSLAPSQREAAAARPRFRRGQALKIYISFGTVIWRYYAAPAAAALTALAEVFAGLDADVIVSLGGHDLDQATHQRLAAANVSVAGYVDQWAILKEADVFVTHHGLNSTHEAIFHEVPMLSYPFFDDQPALARRCADLGLAVPLADTPRAALDRGTILVALQRLTDERNAFGARLVEARGWELAAIAGREVVLDRILALAQATGA